MLHPPKVPDLIVSRFGTDVWSGLAVLDRLRENLRAGAGTGGPREAWGLWGRALPLAFVIVRRSRLAVGARHER